MVDCAFLLFLSLSFDDVFADALRKVFGVAGSGENDIAVKVVAKSLELINHFCKSVVIASADFEGGVNKDVAYIVVAGKKSRKEAIERVEVRDVVFVDVDKADTVVNVETKSLPSLNCNYAALAAINSFFNAVDEKFGFS